MAQYPMFPMWVQDYLADTSHLNATEHGVYHLLLYRYWLTDCKPLPEDLNFLLRVTKCRSKRVVAQILAEFWELSTGEGWRHKRAESEFHVTQERSSVARKNAKKRWEINDHTYATAMPRQCSPSPDPEEEKEEKKNLPTEGKKKRRKPADQKAPIPDGLNVKAWAAYVDYRRETRRPKLKPASEARLQRWLVQQGDGEQQSAVVDQTIRNGWTGLFELKRTNGDDYDRPIRGSADWYAERDRRREQERLDAQAPGRLLDGDDGVVWTKLEN